MCRRLVLLFAAAAALLLPASASAGGPPQVDHRFAVGLFHFNVQYVAGGLEGFVEDLELEDIWAGLDYTSEGVEDAIIRESLLPLLEMYAAHPDWGADIEMQGYMVDVIAERHPDVLELMQQLDGQLAWDSFHYSDELWTAQPVEAIARSRQEAADAFDRAGLTIGRSNFTQEGQFSMGMVEVLPADHFGLIPRNLFGMHYPDSERRPVFSVGTGRATVAGHSWTQEVGEATWEVRSTFMDDGELLATGGIAPYFLPSFLADPAEVAQYETELLARVDEGYEIATLQTALDSLLNAGYVPEPLPPIADGAWQPEDTGNLALWMGDWGLEPGIEGDGLVRTEWARAYAEVRAATLILGDDATAEAWRELMLSGVSDSTGWRPLRTELAYSLDHAQAARDLVFWTLEVAAGSCEACMTRIDGHSGEIRQFPEPAWTIEEAEPALDGVLAGAQDAEVTLTTRWITDSRYEQGVAFEVTFEGLERPDEWDRWVEIPWDQDVFRYIPAGRLTDWAEIPMEVFDEDVPVGQPLANGLLDLGDGLFLVLEPQTMNLAARVHPDQDFVAFVDRTPGGGDSETWRIWFVQGEAEAEALAMRLVQEPDVWLVPGRPIMPPVDCSCMDSVAGRTSAPFVGLLLLVGLLRRRR
jgi:hypothetical protein